MRLLALVLLAACTPTTGEFTTRFARASCQALDDCHEAPWRGDDCEFEMAESVADTTACKEMHCTFDDHAARACLARIRDSECADFADGTAYEACADVWVDCDTDVGECL